MWGFLIACHFVYLPKKNSYADVVPYSAQIRGCPKDLKFWIKKKPRKKN
jgi:hypothetical protein